MNDHAEGGDALIHLRVPQALKARWVRESRAAGAKLTDWIVERVERKGVQIMEKNTEIWVAWLDGTPRSEGVEFEVPLEGTFDVAEAGARALGVEVSELLNVARAQ